MQAPSTSSPIHRYSISTGRMKASSVLVGGTLLLFSSSALSLQPEKRPQAPTTSTSTCCRRGLISKCVAAAGFGLGTTLTIPQRAQAANKPYNPLNLKGSFWETGELYVKKNEDLPSDPDELLPSITNTISALESLEELVLEGKFDEVLRQLRGGSISESQLRLRGYALLDQLPEDDKKSYLAEQAFRIFLTRFANLDATVEAAARQAKIDGGLVETLGLAVVSPFGAANEVAKISQEPNLGNDSRINVLASLGSTTKSLRGFAKAADEALRKNQ